MSDAPPAPELIVGGDVDSITAQDKVRASPASCSAACSTPATVEPSATAVSSSSADAAAPAGRRRMVEAQPATARYLAAGRDTSRLLYRLWLALLQPTLPPIGRLPTTRWVQARVPTSVSGRQDAQGRRLAQGRRGRLWLGLAAVHRRGRVLPPAPGPPRAGVARALGARLHRPEEPTDEGVRAPSSQGLLPPTTLLPRTDEALCALLSPLPLQYSFPRNPASRQTTSSPQ